MSERERICIGCGEPFNIRFRTSTQKYCSFDCCMRDRNKKARARRKDILKEILGEE